MTRLLLFLAVLAAVVWLIREWSIRRLNARLLNEPKDSSRRLPGSQAKGDLPQAFGYKRAWLAIRTHQGEEVVEALGLKRVRRVGWNAGLSNGWDGGPFVSPPIAGWTLVVEAPAIWEENKENVLAQLRDLSARFGEAHYYQTHRVVEQHTWARAREGELERAYCWLGESGVTVLDRGEETEIEQDLHLLLLEEGAEDDGQHDDSLEYPSEETVMEIARSWSVSPTDLDEIESEPGLGWIGKVPN